MMIMVRSWVSFIFIREEHKINRILSYVEYDEFSNKTLITRMHHPNSIGAAFIGSSYGLICMSLGGNDYASLYICNPITDEYTILPKLVPSYSRSLSYSKGRMAVGFGYHPSTNQYKAVRICSSSGFSSRVEVYTLGAGNGWRDIGEINFYPFYIINQWCGVLPGKLANGVIHWLCKKRMIVAFDLADEEFRYLSLPSCFSPDDDSIIELLVLGGGGLCVGRYNGDAKSVEIWSLKKSGEWEMMFSVVDKFVPLVLIKGGEVLSSYNYKFLCRYDPKTGTMENLVEFGECPSSLVRHMHTFVSLKGLGEEVGIISSTPM